MTTINFSCPSCGAQVKFKLRSSVFSVCAHCSLMLVRHDIDIESFGKMVQMPVDMSPLKLGSYGIYEKSRFEIIGRRRVGWESSSWNEWYLNFDSGKEGWLTDAQGQIMICFQTQHKTELPKVTDLKACSLVKIDQVTYSVNDIRKVNSIASEGELPFKCDSGKTSTSVDLVSGRDIFANIDYASEETRFYLGKYLDFSDLQFQNLKVIDGW